MFATRRALLRLGAGAFLPMDRAFAAPTEADARDQVARFNTTLISLMKAGDRATFSDRLAMLGPVVDQVFDLAGILATSVGFYWRGLPVGQQNELGAVFREFVLASYVSAFNHYDGELARVDPAVRSLGARQIVSASLSRPGSGDAATGYVMAQANGIWRVQDILLDGTISRVAMQRSDFRSFLAAGDGSRLIARLRDKAAQLRASA